MSLPEQRAVQWLNHAIKWLNWDQDGGDSLSEPARLLLEKLETRYQKKEVSEALELVDSLKALGEKSDVSELAEIRLKSCIALAEMSLFKEALLASHDSVSKFKQGHKHGVALWMEGCILWVLHGKQIDAISSWRDSIKSFDALRKAKRAEVDKFKWYNDRCIEMEKALRIATKQYAIPGLPPYGDSDNPVLSSEEDSKSNSKTNFEKESVDWLEISHIYEHIQAGDFGPSGPLSQPVGELEIKQVFINGCPYRIQSLNGSRFVRAIPTDNINFTVVKVSGDSMINAGIQDGDYILLRLLPKNTSDFDITDMNPEDAGFYLDADHSQIVKDNDIVAAEIFNEDNEIVLKRIFRRGKKVVLKPENPKYKEREFQGMNQGFVVSGVAIAVFKDDSPR